MDPAAALSQQLSLLVALASDLSFGLLRHLRHATTMMMTMMMMTPSAPAAMET